VLTATVYCVEDAEHHDEDAGYAPLKSGPELKNCGKARSNLI
jgi:hypothetical protein